jgi:3-oxoacyl-[acyl-carrier-protein] synthase III
MALKGSILQIEHHVPAAKVSNEDLAAEFGDWDVQKIFEKTGINIRGVAGPDECASDLGTAAAQRLFAHGKVRREEVDYLIFCTQSPDYMLPATACLIQTRLGLRTSCGALDINQGCSGFVYGLSIAKGLVEASVARNVLLITADTYTKYIHPSDRSVRTIFGDAAAATIVTAVDTDKEAIGPFILGTDGRGASNLIVEAGGSRRPIEPFRAASGQEVSGPSAANLHMNGAEVFTFTLKEVPKAVMSLLAKSGLSLETVDYFVFHQANRFMLEQLQKKIGIPSGKFCMNFQDYGNTVSSTIPIALQLAMERGHVSTGSKVMLVGFGVGYSWAAAMVQLQ